MTLPIILVVPEGQTIVLDLGSQQLMVRRDPDAPKLWLEDTDSGTVQTLIAGSPPPMPEATTTFVEEEPSLTIGQHLEIAHNREHGIDRPPQEPVYEAGTHFSISPTPSEQPAPRTPESDARRDVIKQNPLRAYEFPPTNLDALLAGAVVPGPTPAEEIIRSSSSPPIAPAPAPNAPSGTVSIPLEGAQEPAQPAAPRLPTRAMDDKPPRDGSYVMLENGTEPLAARWSSKLGQQFWFDEAEQSLGFDDDFIGWRLPTAEEREEFGL